MNAIKCPYCGSNLIEGEHEDGYNIIFCVNMSCDYFKTIDKETSNA